MISFTFLPIQVYYETACVVEYAVLLIEKFFVCEKEKSNIQKLITYKPPESGIVSAADLSTILQQTIDTIPWEIDNTLSMLGYNTNIIWPIFVHHIANSEGTITIKLMKALQKSVRF